MENLFTPDCVRTFSGQYINLKSPDPTTIFPIDLAVHLARVPRFAGGTKKSYSVAEHSVWCALRAEEMFPNNTHFVFKVLMHDAHEFILGDLASPIKELVPGYKSLATKIQNAIDTRFRCWVNLPERKTISSIDAKALQWEWENKKLKWTGLELDPEAAGLLFLDHFKRLCKTPYVIHP